MEHARADRWLGDARKRFLSLVSLVAVGLVAVAVLTTVMLVRAQPSVSAGPGFPAHYFAPYVDTSLNKPASLPGTAQAAGVKFYTLAFILSGGSGCQAMWNGVTPVTQGFFASDINSLRGMGGDVAISFGGANGIELGQQCSDVASLQAAYQSVIDNYAVKHLDFDIEGAAVADPGSVDRRNKAIVGLQRANPGLFVTYTLPVLPTGLTQDGVNLLKNAISNGVAIGVVNIMTMDYGSSFPPNQMGQNAIQAGQSLANQLKSLFPSKSTAQVMAMEGNTPMIGVNDTQPEVTTLQDAQSITTWAQQNGVTELAMWSVGRDQPCPGGATGGSASPTCSGVSQQPLDFSRIFNPFTSGGTVPPPAPGPSSTSTSTSTPTPIPTPTPTPVPGSTPTPAPAPAPAPTPTPPPPSAGNLLSNPGFETGDLSGWSCSKLDTVVSSPVHSGRSALSAAATDSDNAQCTQSIHVQPNHTYTLSAWIQGNYAFIGVTGMGMNDASTFTPSSSTYTQLKVSFKTGANTTSVTTYVHGWYLQGTIMADDLAVS